MIVLIVRHNMAKILLAWVFREEQVEIRIIKVKGTKKK